MTEGRIRGSALGVLVGLSLLVPGAVGADGMLEDPPDDVRLSGWVCLQDCVEVPGVAPMLPTAEHVDIIEAGVAEETDGDVLARIDLAGAFDAPQVTGVGLTAQALTYSLHFEVNNDGNDHEATLRHFGQVGDATEWSARWSRSSCNGDVCSREGWSFPQQRFNYSTEESLVSFTIPKDWFWVGPTHRPIRGGDAVSQVRVLAIHWILLGTALLNAFDEAEGDVAFPFTRDAPNSVVSLEFVDPAAAGGGDDGETTAGPGRPAAVRGPVSLLSGSTKALPLLVTNEDGLQRSVELSGRMLGEGGAELAGWRVQTPARVVVPPFEHRVVNVLVTAPSDGKHREGGELVVEATVPDEPDVRGSARREAYVAQGLTPESNRLFFHSATGSEPPFAEPLFGDAFQPKTVAWSPFAEDPVYDDPTVDAAMSPFHGTQDVVQPAELVLAPGGKVEVLLHLFSERAERSAGFGVSVDADMPSGIGLHLGAATGNVVVPEGGVDVVLSVPVSEAALVLAEGSRLRLSLSLWDRLPFAGAVWTHPGIKLDPSRSFAVLPIREVRVPELQFTSGEFLPTLTLAEGQPSERFVNPGKVVSFNLSLVNGGSFEDTLDVTITPSSPVFVARVLPAATYRLAPGASVALGVEVEAPMGEEEGAMSDLAIRAVSRNDPAAWSEAVVRVTVTQNVELANESYVASPESLALAVPPDERNGSPAPGLAIVLLAAWGSLLRGRARRRAA